MTELERRALLGDKQAQEECTEKGIVLMCPLCGGAIEQAITSHVFKCKKCGCVFNFPLNVKCFDTANFVKKINTRPTPPIGRCGECNYCIKTKAPNIVFCSAYKQEKLLGDFCNYFEPKECEE